MYFITNATHLQIENDFLLTIGLYCYRHFPILRNHVLYIWMCMSFDYAYRLLRCVTCMIS